MLLVPLLAQLLLGGNSPETSVLGRVLGAQDTASLVVRLTLFIVSVFVLKNVVAVVFRYWSLGFIQRQQAATSRDLLDRYLHAPHQGHIARSTAVTLRRLESSVVQVYSVLVVSVVTIITETLTIVVILVALAVVTGFSFLVGAAVVAALAASAVVLSRVSRRVGEASLHATHDTYRVVLRALGSYREIRLRALEQEVLADFGQVSLRAARAAQLAGFLGELPRYLLETVFLVTLGVTVMWAAPDVAAAGGTLALLVVVAFRLLPSSTRLLSSWASARMAVPAVREVVDDLSTAAIREASAGHTPLSFERHLELDDVRFRYSPDQNWVLAGVTGRVPRGARIALVGPSGAGKSTLVDVLSGLVTDYEGQITVDDVPLRGREPDWRPHVAIVPQDPYIQHDTLLRNIVVTGTGPVDTERLADAVRDAQLGDVVDGLPDGLETVLAERGLGLSGGQRQRIALARALYRRASFLILDEATSALDTDTETRVIDALAALPREVTVIVVAHRLRTAYAMEHVAVLEGGAVAAFGTADAVAASNETFRRWVGLNGPNVSS